MLVNAMTDGTHDSGSTPPRVRRPLLSVSLSDTLVVGTKA